MKERVLIIANARFKGGSSGSDKIYESFEKYWPASVSKHSVDCDYRPFFLCYLQRIIVGCIMALAEPKHYDTVYSSSDFLPDCLSGFLFKLRGYRWVAGYYLEAPKKNKIHYWSQKISKWLINKFSDMVIVTNPTMFRLFPDKKKTWINGGIDLELAGISEEKKLFDAVWCGRIHYTKGIDELCDVWIKVKSKNPRATLALIGDGDMGIGYIKKRLGFTNGVHYFGFMGNERYSIYKMSKLVLYTTPIQYDHFSMAPVEAMACGCPCVSFNLETAKSFNPTGWIICNTIDKMAEIVNYHPIIRNLNEDAFTWASKFNYKDEAIRVYKEIHENINNRSLRGTRDSSKAIA